MILGIDASNIRGGGGVTHLVELLRAADPQPQGFSEVIIWGGEKTLSLIEDRPWLKKRSVALLNKALLYRLYWQRAYLTGLAKAAACDLLFAPGGSFTAGFQPFVTMNQNLLPFEWRELWRFGLSIPTIRMLLLRWVQSITLKKANAVIFLTEYARRRVMQVVGVITSPTVIIPHGVNCRFRMPPRNQLSISSYSHIQPFRILYVSTVSFYKHQWNVAEAVAELRRRGFPVILELVGPAYAPALKKLRKTLARIDPQGTFILYHGEVPYSELSKQYANAELFIFASSCENMPNVLLEAMATGLPIACSERGPMPEVLGDAGIYFDPENPQDIAAALQKLIENPGLCRRKAQIAHDRAESFTWERCSHETFSFLAQVARESNRASLKKELPT